MSFDGTDIWVSLNIGLARLRPADGKLVGSFIQLGARLGWRLTVQTSGWLWVSPTWWRSSRDELHNEKLVL